MFVLNGKPLALDAPFEHEGVNYPANWLRLASPEERAAIGITEEPDPPTWDQEFFWGPDLPKDHAQLVELWAAKTRETCGLLIAPTDWMVVREADNGTAVPADVKAQRQGYRDRCAEKIAIIEGTTTTEELRSYIRGISYPAWEYAPAAPGVSDGGQG